jgi:DNA-binding CsgD family transcriptional regulator
MKGNEVALTMGELVGRDEELLRLSELISGVHESGSALVLIGEPGIGKSTLLKAARECAGEAGFEVLSTVGVETEAGLPFAGLHQLVQPVLSALEGLPEPQRLAVSSAFGLVDGPPPEPFLVALAVLNALAACASRRPIVVSADDVHWLDAQTQHVLTFLARRVSMDQIVILGTTRTGIPSVYVSAGLPELEVRGLTEQSSRQLLAQRAGDLPPSAVRRIVREARGNPLALIELPKAWQSPIGVGEDMLPPILPVTSKLERTFAGRACLLPELTRDALLVAAVDGNDELHEVLAAASQLSGAAVTVQALVPAVDAGLVSMDSAHVVFRHPLVRSALLAAEPIHRVHAANGALADILSEPYRRSWHRGQSIVGPDDAIADELEAVASIPLRRGAVMSAILCLERSAQLTSASVDRGHRYLVAAEHAFGLGQKELVTRLVRTASREEISPLDRSRMEWLAEIFNDGVPGDPAKVLDLCDVADDAARQGDVDLALNLLLAAALRCWWADTGPLARQYVVSAAERLGVVGSDPRYVAVLAVAEPILRGSTVLHLLADVVIEDISEPDELRLFGMSAHAVGNSVLASAFFDRAENRLRNQGRLGLLPHVLNMAVPVRLIVGEWDRAAAATEEGRQLAQETGQPIWEAGAMTGDARASGLRGEIDRALRIAAEAEQIASGMRLNCFLACVQLARGFAWAAGRRYEEAYRELRRLYDPDDPAFHHRELFAGVMFLAESAVHVDKVEDARVVLAGLEEVAKVTSAPDLHVNLLYARAVLADDGLAESLYLDALKEDLVRWPWIRARIELAYGQWLRRHRRSVDSRAPLRSALATLELVGAGSWADQARTELRAAGERVEARESGVHELLSAQELQIARLAAQGRSNREIGYELYLSPRTVGSHLYRIFPKLNVTSRSQLAGRLSGVAVPEP